MKLEHLRSLASELFRLPSLFISSSLLLKPDCEQLLPQDLLPLQRERTELTRLRNH